MHIYEIDSRLRKLMDGEIEEYVNMETGEVDRERLNEEIKNLHMAAEEREESLACLAAEKRAAADVLKEKAKAISVEIEDMRALPGSFIRVKTVEEPDKVAIGNAIKAGQAVPGAYLKENIGLRLK